MRDVERIDRLLKKLRIIWKRRPDQRLAQLILNICEAHELPYDAFHFDDDDMEDRMDELIERYNDEQ